MSERTILYDQHLAAGARMVDFHGWEMPVQYAGIVQEHQAVRTGCGAFDLCHMGRLRLSGPASTNVLAASVCRPIRDMEPGVVRYGLVLTEQGGVEDDVLVSREGPESWHVVVNASNRERILALWRPLLPPASLADVSATEAMIALQGPRAIATLSALGLDASPLKAYRFLDTTWRGTTVRLSRTGYTGEDGCECFLSSARAAELWRAALSQGATPCGLGARDTLRLEGGMPLYGNELDHGTTPVEAGLTFAVGKQGGYRGDTVVLEQLAHGTKKRLVGLRMAEKRVPRSHYPVLASAGGAQVGTITSGTLSPTLGAAIGMAYVPSALASPGTALAVDIRGQSIPATVVPLPFYKRAR